MAAGAMGVRTIHQQDAKAQLTVEMLPAGEVPAGATAEAGGEAGGYDSGEDSVALDAALVGGAGEAELRVLARPPARPLAAACRLQHCSGQFLRQALPLGPGRV